MLSAIGIVTEDLNSSKEFYELFGYKFQAFGDGNHLEAKLGTTKIMIDSLELVQKRDPNFKLSSSPQVCLCFEFDSTDDLIQKYNEIVNKGFKSKKEPFDAFWGQKYAIVLDPSENPIDLYCEL